LSPNRPRSPRPPSIVFFQLRLVDPLKIVLLRGLYQNLGTCANHCKRVENRVSTHTGELFLTALIFPFCLFFFFFFFSFFFLFFPPMRVIISHRGTLFPAATRISLDETPLSMAPSSMCFQPWTSLFNLSFSLFTSFFQLVCCLQCPGLLRAFSKNPNFYCTFFFCFF